MNCSTTTQHNTTQIFMNKRNAHTKKLFREEADKKNNNINVYA